MSEALPQDAARGQPVEAANRAVGDRPGLVRRLFAATYWLHKPYDWTYVKVLQHRKPRRHAGASSGT